MFPQKRDLEKAKGRLLTLYQSLRAFRTWLRGPTASRPCGLKKPWQRRRRRSQARCLLRVLHLFICSATFQREWMLSYTSRPRLAYSDGAREATEVERVVTLLRVGLLFLLVRQSWRSLRKCGDRRVTKVRRRVVPLSTLPFSDGESKRCRGCRLRTSPAVWPTRLVRGVWH